MRIDRFSAIIIKLFQYIYDLNIYKKRYEYKIQAISQLDSA